MGRFRQTKLLLATAGMSVLLGIGIANAAQAAESSDEKTKTTREFDSPIKEYINCVFQRLISNNLDTRSSEDQESSCEDRLEKNIAKKKTEKDQEILGVVKEDFSNR